MTNSVTLIRITSQGQAIGSPLGLLYDDGSHGDDVAGDGVYTGQFVFNEPPVIGNISLAVTAAYRGELLRFRSPVFSISVLTPWTDAQLNSTTQIQNQAGRFFQTMRGQLGDIGARLALIDFLRRQSGVLSAGLSEDNQTVWVTYDSGISGFVLASAPGTQGGGGISRVRSKAVSNTMCPPRPAGGVFAIQAQSQQAIVLAPFYDQFSPDDSSYSVAADLSAACFGPIQPYITDLVTVHLMQSLYKYSIIAINTHGGVGPGNFGLPPNQVAIATREHLTVENIRAHADDFNSTNHPSRLAGCTVPLVGGGTLDVICILPEFVRHYAQPGGFPKSLVFLNACDTVGDYTQPANLSMWNAFQENGAATYLGWRNSVSHSFAGPTFQSFFDYLISDPTHTTGAAYSSLPNGIVDSSVSPPATLNIQGDRNRTLCGSQSAAAYSIIPMDQLPTSYWVYPTGINNAGQVIGGYNGQPFVWSASAGGHFLTLIPGDSFGAAAGINDSGQVVGFGYNPSVLQPQHALIWNASSIVQDLRPVFGGGSSANVINNSALVGGSVGPSAVEWSVSTGLKYLPVAGTGNTSTAVALSNFGRAAGTAQNYPQPIRAIFWPSATNFVDMGISAPNVSVTGINDSDAVIGNYGPASGRTAFMWKPTTGATVLGTLFPTASCSENTPRGINGSGQIVGRSNPCDGSQFKAFIWQTGTMQDLNTLIPSNSNWQLIEADGINNSGQIVGYGLFNGQQRGFVMTPNH